MSSLWYSAAVPARDVQRRVDLLCELRKRGKERLFETGTSKSKEKESRVTLWKAPCR